MCKPIFPLIQDELAHIFWKAKHLATIHHHHGDHHAEAEIAEAQHEEDHKQPSTTKTFESVSAHMVIEILYSIPEPTIQRLKFGVINFDFTLVSLDKRYPPPKHC